MALGFGGGTATQVALGLSGFQNAGVSAGGGGQVFSMLSQGNSNINNIATQNYDANSFFCNQSLYPLLKNYELTNSILGIYKSFIDDVLNSCDWEIKGTKHNKECTEFLKKINLKNILVNQTKDALYYGSYSFFIDYTKEHLIELLDPYNLILCRKLGKDYRYIFKTLDQNLEEDEIEDIIDCSHIGSLMFDPQLIGSIGINKQYKFEDDEECEEDEIVREICEENEYFRNKLSTCSYYKGTSAVENIMSLLFEHFLTSLMRLLLKLKNTTKPFLFKVEIGEDATAEQNIVEAINSIESFLNQGEFTFDLRTSNASTIITTLYNTFVNQNKVVPSMKNFADISKIDVPNLTELLDQLSEDLEKKRAEIIQNSGVPEELMTKGNDANKWEVLSRSNRFNTKIKSAIGNYVQCVKSVVQNYLRIKFNEIISLDDIEFNIDKNNYMKIDNFTTGIVNLNKNFEELSNLIELADRLSQFNIVSPDKLCKFLLSKLHSLDSEYAYIIDLEKVKKVIMENSQSDEEIEEEEQENEIDEVKTINIETDFIPTRTRSLSPNRSISES